MSSPSPDPVFRQSDYSGKTRWIQPNTPKIPVEITLCKKEGFYCWLRDDGTTVSPVFNTVEAAIFFVGRIPFLTDEEWKEYHPTKYRPAKFMP